MEIESIFYFLFPSEISHFGFQGVRENDNNWPKLPNFLPREKTTPKTLGALRMQKTT